MCAGTWAHGQRAHTHVRRLGFVLKVTWDTEDWEVGGSVVENPVKCASAGSGHETILTFRIEFRDL